MVKHGTDISYVIGQRLRSFDRACDQDPARALQSIMDGLAETVLEASEDEILAESYEAGIDPFGEAMEVREILLEAAHRALSEDSENAVAGDESKST